MKSLVCAVGVCLGLLLHGAASAADCPPATPPLTPDTFTEAAKHASDRGLLWSITKGDRVSYLYGTFHAGRQEWLAPGPQLRQALMRSDVLALELDTLDPQVLAEVAEAVSRVKRELPAALKVRLQAAWEAQCLPAAALKQGASEFQVMALTFAVLMREGLYPDYGSEMLLTHAARGLRRPVMSLETAATQLRALLAQDDAEAIRFIAETLDDIERGKAREVLVKTAQVWEQGDLAQLERYSEWCGCLDTETDRKLMARTLDDRNPGLADRIDEVHMQGKHVLAAVGALHMVGPKGLVALLATRGYRVQRLH